MNLNYLFKISIFTGIIAVLSFLFYYFGFPGFYIPVIPFVILFYTLVAIVFHFILVAISKHKISKFANYFMLTSTLKLIAYIFFIVIYLLLKKENAVPFIVYFFLLYIGYTAFEILIVLPEIKKSQ